MMSNHFRFAHRVAKEQAIIYIYRIDYGVLSDRDLRFDALRSIDSALKGMFAKYMNYGSFLFSTTFVE